MKLPRDALQMRPNGPVVVFPPRTQKKGTSPVAPISQTTYDLVKRILEEHKHPLVFGPVKWKHKGVWLYRLVKRVGAEAEISVRFYPHLLRHLKALEFRRNGVKEDTVINTLGWRDATLYNSRHGRRQAFETAEEARAHLNEPQNGLATLQRPQTVQTEQAQGDQTAEALRMLMGLLNEGKIDLETYKKSLLALTGKRPRVQNGKKQVFYTLKKVLDAGVGRSRKFVIIGLCFLRLRRPKEKLECAGVGI